MRELTKASQFAVDEETWPPYWLKSFTPLLFMHYKGQRNLKQASAVAELTYGGKIDHISSMSKNQLIPMNQSDSHTSLKEVLDNSMVTKEIEEILAPLEKKFPFCFVLIEGPPGIGKSVLLKEISCRWANKQLLKAFKLVLLVCLRDPMVQQSKSIDDLLQLYCKGDKRATELTGACSDHLFGNGGEDLIFLLDGFDELPKDLQKHGFIIDILNRKVLPNCGLVLSSRPHASENFHKTATVIVDILGFTEEDRKYCIEQAFQGKPDKKKELLQYLENHLPINSLCFVPFNMVILLYLYQQGISLPKNSTDMYNHFICLTVCRHIAKGGHHLSNTITHLSNLPEPYNETIKQLSSLSLQAVDQNKLVFTLDEIKAICPNIEIIPGGINCFGLMQAVQHFGLTGKTLTFHFLHFTVQEYLAACHITKLPPQKKLQIFKEKFWSLNYFNTFAMYVALTKGQQTSFKEFLSDGDETVNISQRFLNDGDLCLYLYRCFHEAGDQEMCTSIANAKIFENKVIRSFGNSYRHIECLILFLTTSPHRVWVVLNLNYVHFQDYAFFMLHRGLKDRNVTITELWLVCCGLTSSHSMLISDIVISCKVKVLMLDGNKTIGENDELYSMLSHPSTTLEILSMYETKLSSRAANILFTVLKQNNALKILSIEANEITDHTCSFIANMLEQNNFLTNLWMRFNQISAAAIELILQSLQSNDTLKLLRLPDYPNDVKKKFKSTEEKINKTRESHGSDKLFIDFNISLQFLHRDVKFIN